MIEISKSLNNLINKIVITIIVKKINKKNTLYISKFVKYEIIQPNKKQKISQNEYSFEYYFQILECQENFLLFLDSKNLTKLHYYTHN